MKLLGAKHFLDMPKGTFFIPYWCDSLDECEDIINKFVTSKLVIGYEDLHIYGDNTGSMSFNKDEEDYIYYYDINVVGDACPETTIYLILDEDEIPQSIMFEPPTFYDEGLHLNKGQILRTRHQFLKIFNELNNKNEPNNEYARIYLNKHENEHKIYNLCLVSTKF